MPPVGKLGIQTGSSSMREVSGPLFGAEYTMSLSHAWDFGGFYDHNFMTPNSEGFSSLSFFGALGRIHLGFVPGLFVDGKIGATQAVVNEVTSKLVLGGGAGAGYRIQLGQHAELSPHLGVRVLPDLYNTAEPTRKIVDMSMLFSIKF
jgi:hypothetical protein